MKCLLAALALLAAFFPFSASAQAPWAMTSFEAHLRILRDGSVEVVETIGADFLEPRHGIYRYVPYEGKDDAGKRYRLDVHLDSVTMDGARVDVDVSKENGNVEWKIGEADQTLTGAHVYVLRYRVDGAVRAFDTYDEVYWNVTGEGWDASLPRSSADVTLPGAIAAEDFRVACYTGAYGSTAADCSKKIEGSSVSFVVDHDGDPLTIAVGFPKGLVVGPPLWKRALRAMMEYGPWLSPLLVFAYAYRHWRRHGDDAPLGTIVAQYDPPTGLTPAETRALLSQNADVASLAPTIVDLASRGYMRIDEIETKGILLTSKDYALVQVKDGRTDKTLRPFERQLLSALFTGDVGQNVLVSSLKNSFYKHIPEFKTGIMASLTERGVFDKNPDSVRKWWMVAGIVFIVAAFVLSMHLVPIFVSGIIVLSFGWFMPKWSSQGLEAARHARGYKEFISKVEKYRAPWMEEQNIFFNVLPYALAFGLGAKWAKAFEGLKTEPPSWYHGASLAAWSPTAFTNSLDGWSKSFTSMAVSSPSSRSGSGGGGFSGGGFGGGGGGSW